MTIENTGLSIPFGSKPIPVFNGDPQNYLTRGDLVYQFAENQLSNVPALPQSIEGRVVVWLKDSFHWLLRKIYSIFHRYEIADARNTIWCLLTNPTKTDQKEKLELLESVVHLSMAHAHILPDFAFYQLFYGEKILAMQSAEQAGTKINLDDLTKELEALRSAWVSRGYILSESRDLAIDSRRSLFVAYNEYIKFLSHFLLEEEKTQMVEHLVAVAENDFQNVNKNWTEDVIILTDTLHQIFPFGIGQEHDIINIFTNLTREHDSESFKDFISVFIEYSLICKNGNSDSKDVEQIINKHLLKLENPFSKAFLLFLADPKWEHLDINPHLKNVRKATLELSNEKCLTTEKLLYRLLNETNEIDEGNKNISYRTPLLDFLNVVYPQGFGSNQLTHNLEKQMEHEVPFDIEGKTVSLYAIARINSEEVIAFRSVVLDHTHQEAQLSSIIFSSLFPPAYYENDGSNINWELNRHMEYLKCELSRKSPEIAKIIEENTRRGNFRCFDLIDRYLNGQDVEDEPEEGDGNEFNDRQVLSFMIDAVAECRVCLSFEFLTPLRKKELSLYEKGFRERLIAVMEKIWVMEGFESHVLNIDVEGLSNLRVPDLIACAKNLLDAVDSPTTEDFNVLEEIQYVPLSSED